MNKSETRLRTFLDTSWSHLRDVFSGPEWIYGVGGIYLFLAYFWFLDDAFVYFRYVDNLLFLDLGLVYNEGEYVEGYSSPLWAMLLSAFRAFGLSYTSIIKILGLASYAGFWLILVVLNKKLSGNSDGAINFPLVYLSFCYGVLCYFSSGLETPLVQFTAVAFALYLLEPRLLIIETILALSPLVRHELLLPLIISILWTLYYHKKWPWRLIVLSAIAGMSWLTFRIYYYADLFPNTFYLKDAIDFRQGFIYLHESMSTYHVYGVAVFFILLVAVLKFLNESIQLAPRLMMLVVAGSVALYVIKIGGDPRHFRYLAFSFCLGAASLSGLLERAFSLLFPNRLRFLKTGLGVSVALLVFSFYPPQLDKHPINSKVGHRTVNKINDSVVHRQHDSLQTGSWQRGNTRLLKKYRNRRANFTYEKVLIHNWCATMYGRFDVRYVHSFGLTEPVLGRTKMGAFRPAHKNGLIPMAQQIAKIHESNEGAQRGMYRRSIESGLAPSWVEKNIEKIEIIEAKMFNEHKLMENLALAFTFPGKITP